MHPIRVAIKIALNFRSRGCREADLQAAAASWIPNQLSLSLSLSFSLSDCDQLQWGREKNRTKSIHFCHSVHRVALSSGTRITRGQVREEKGLEKESLESISFVLWSVFNDRLILPTNEESVSLFLFLSLSLSLSLLSFNSVASRQIKKRGCTVSSHQWLQCKWEKRKVSRRNSKWHRWLNGN